VKGFASATPDAEDPDGVAGAKEKWKSDAKAKFSLAIMGEHHSFRAPLPQVAHSKPR
jgi:hypothetical protein